MKWYTTEVPSINIRKALKAAPVASKYQGHLRLTIGNPYNSTISLPITATTPHYGGYRSWFVCPQQSCGRRTTDLYVQDGMIACRKCLHLMYETQYYPNGTVHGALLAFRKASELKKSGRRLWYSGQPTRAGNRYLRHIMTAQQYELARR